MRRTTLRIAVCGRLHGAEADAVAAALLQIPAEADVRWIAGPPADWPQAAGDADLCIALQGWPEEIPARDAHALIAACAAGRLICCQGAWCASVGRTRAIWPPALTAPVELLLSRLNFELAVLSGDRPPLPATASRDEAFAAHYAPSPPDINLPAVVVDSPDLVYARELCRALNPSEPEEPPRWLIIDVDPWDDSRPQRLGDAARAHPQAAVIAVAGFPLGEQTAECAAAGMTATVARTSPLSELLSAIHAGIGIHARNGAS